MTDTAEGLRKAEKALEVLVLAYKEEQRKQRKPEAPLTATPFQWRDPVTMPTRREIYRDRIINDPMVGALRLAIREIGEHIWQKTQSNDAMLTALNNVAARHPHMECRIISAVEHAWDGIGNWCC